MFIGEEAEEDKVGFDKAKAYIKNQKKVMEEAKQAAKRLELSKEDKLAVVRKEAADKVNAMTNKAAAAYYKDENLVAIIEERIDLVPIIGASTSSPKSLVTTATLTTTSNRVKRKSISNIPNDETSVASSITIELLLSK